jgi:signal transduction histidine kinase
MGSVSRTLLARVRALPPYRLDALVGAVVYVEICFELAAFAGLRGPKLALAFLLAVGFGLALALRRREPIAAVALGTAGMLTGVLLGPEVTDNVTSPFFVTIFVTFTAGARLEGRRLVAAFLIGTAFIATSVAVDAFDNDVPSYLFSITFSLAAPMLFGQLLRNRSRLNQALREKAQRAEQARAEEAEVAALEERTRIASELHDVVAHALSAMTVQATAARRLAEREPARAATAFAAVEGTGREALTELRRLLGVLRKADEELALAPQPSLVHVEGLARRATAAGLPVALRVTGAARPLPAGVDLTAYRVVQEALGRARDAGSAGRADVTVAYGADDVSVEIRDDGAHAERGLLGMRERVAVYGGELSTAAIDGGGWRVTARLPAEAHA